MFRILNFLFDGKQKISYFSSSQFVEHFLSFLTKYKTEKKLSKSNQASKISRLKKINFFLIEMNKNDYKFKFITIYDTKKISRDTIIDTNI